jgi:DEAD/DEAH box helicase domain-containing protein
VDVKDFLEWLAKQELFEGQDQVDIMALPRKAKTVPLPESLHERVINRLHDIGIQELYHHQAEAVEIARQGNDLMVITGTNSGKTFCYALPTLDTMCREPAARALYIYPTKALAQDQLSRLERLAPGGDVRVGTYDGDTPVSRRASLRKLGHILLTNPDMLHVGILPNHESWTTFLKNLRWIVLDEVHSYRGLFGANVGLVLRRLLRLCAWHGANPQIICCSATIGNPLGLFESLTGRIPKVVDEDTSPQGAKHYIFCNPPLLSDDSRLSANFVTAKIVVELCRRGLQSLAFCRSRLATELVLKMAREQAEKSGDINPLKIDSYRSGYTADERRAIEKAVFRGDLQALIATNAMELGVDIGALDAVVMNGYPGTVSSFRQQSGRSGRGDKESLSVLVANDDPLEQFLIREPERLLKFSGESVAVRIENPHVLRPQLLCAAHERPLSAGEVANFAPDALTIAEDLEASGELAFRAGQFFYPSFEPPAPRVNLRGAGTSVRLIVDGEELGYMERWRAVQHAHPGAVYLHRGQTYVGEELRLEEGIAILRKDSPPFYTQPVVHSLIEQTAEIRSKLIVEDTISVVGVRVTETMTGYKRKSLSGDRVLDVITLEFPPETFNTIAVRFNFDFEFEDLEDPSMVEGLHSLEHAFMAVAPLLAGCDYNDIGSAWYLASPDSLKPSLFIFDRAEGGTGLSESLYDRVEEWVNNARQLVVSCGCKDGCPGCLLSPRCSINNEAISKRSMMPWLQRLI